MSSRLDHLEKAGFSLVMSLIFISLLSVLVVGFLTSMRVEVFSADAALQAAKSSNMAQAATDMAIARLQYATGTYTPSMSIWASQPGQILMATRSSTTSSFSGWQRVDLHSGASTSTDANIVADLNRGTSYLVTRSASRMPVCWIYVRKDGTLETTGGTSVPAYNALNPLVGRFAYWVDDECARVNLNTAATRATSSLSLWGSAAQVNLKVFGSTMSDTVITALGQYRTGVTGHYLHTLRDARVISPALSDLVDNDAFSLTVNSQAPELNLFGEPRIVLTTQKSLAGNAPFLDILTSDNSDPGRHQALDASKVQRLVSTLSQILCRTDWPVVTGSSFAVKFTPVLPQQIAVNIIEYVRAKESKEGIIEAIRGAPVGTTGFLFNNATISNTVMGNSRGPRYTEMAYFIKPHSTSTPSALRFYMIIRAEVHLPKYTNLPSIDLNSLTMSGSISLWPNPVYYNNDKFLWIRARINNGTPGAANTAFVVNGGSSTMLPGEYRVIEATTNWFSLGDKSPGVPYTIADISKIWPNLAMMRDDFNGRVAYSTLDGSISYTYSSSLLESQPWPSFEVDDPALSTGNGNWASTGTNPTFGAKPNIPIRTLNTSTTVPGAQQDMDAFGLTNIGMQFPAPAFTLSNPLGVVESVAELGYIHTGMTSLNGKQGVPWRTLRLQPKTDTATLPDWLLLDMFTVPKLHWKNDQKASTEPTSSSAFSYYYQPEMASSPTSSKQRIGGVLNVNSLITPAFPSGTGTLTRTAPLKAAFLGVYTDAASTTTLSAVDAISTNIANRTLAGSGSRYGFLVTDPLISRGQIAELAGVADGLEESENKLRGAIDTLTSRSSTFRVFSIGQAIMQSSAGSITVMGEKRVETVVERVVNDTEQNVKIRPISSQTPKS